MISFHCHSLSTMERGKKLLVFTKEKDWQLRVQHRCLSLLWVTLLYESSVDWFLFSFAFRKKGEENRNFDRTNFCFLLQLEYSACAVRDVKQFFDQMKQLWKHRVNCFIYTASDVPYVTIICRKVIRICIGMVYFFVVPIFKNINNHNTTWFHPIINHHHHPHQSDVIEVRS